MSFQSDINRFKAKVRSKQKSIHRAVAIEMFNSIVKGSPVTNSPGQPVKTGNLRSSWQLRFPEFLLARMTTNVPYAPPIEVGIGRGGKTMTLHSKRGGFHSVALTKAGFKKILSNHMRTSSMSTSEWSRS